MGISGRQIQEGSSSMSITCVNHDSLKDEASFSKNFEKGRMVWESESRLLRGKTSEEWRLFLEIKRSDLWPHVAKVDDGVRHCK